MPTLPDSYDHHLAAAGVRPSAQPHCHRWATLWLKADGPASPDRTSAFFDALGRSTGMADWQFCQPIQAVRILAVECLALPWAAGFPWSSLADQARDLPKQFTLDLDRPTAGRRRPPTVLTREEVRSVLGFLEDPWKLAAQLLYGSGLRVMEALRLRVKDIDFGHGAIAIHDAKGGKHRLVPLPKTLEPRLQSHLATLREKHRQDLIAGVGEVHMPESLARKYPNAPREWPWQFIFPAAKLCPHPRTKK